MCYAEGFEIDVFTKKNVKTLLVLKDLSSSVLAVVDRVTCGKCHRKCVGQVLSVGETYFHHYCFTCQGKLLYMAVGCASIFRKVTCNCGNCCENERQN